MPSAASSSPLKGSIGSPPASGTAIALSAKSRRARSSAIVSPCSGEMSQEMARSSPQHAPGAELLGQREARPAERARSDGGGPVGVAGHCEVDVGERPVEHCVAHDAADQPGLDPGGGERLAQPSHRLRAGQPLEAAHGSCFRGTRAVRPQVTS